MATSCLGIGLYIMTHFLTIFVRISPEAKRTLDAEPEAKKIFIHWHIQEEDWEKLYIKKEYTAGIMQTGSNTTTQTMRGTNNWRNTGQGYSQGSYGLVTFRFTKQPMT